MSRRNRRHESQTAFEAGERTAEHGEGNSHSSETEPESRLGEWRGAIEESARGSLQTLSEFVAEHPVTSLVVGFGAGVGLGVLAVAVLGRREETWWERHRPSASLHGLSEGIRKLPEKVAEYIPESLPWR